MVFVVDTNCSRPNVVESMFSNYDTNVTQRTKTANVGTRRGKNLS
jgi:hypothetical protein